MLEISIWVTLWMWLEFKVDWFELFCNGEGAAGGLYTCSSCVCGQLANGWGEDSRLIAHWFVGSGVTVGRLSLSQH